MGDPAAVGRQRDPHVPSLVEAVGRVDREGPERPGLRDEADGFERAASHAIHPDCGQRSGSVPEIRQFLPNGVFDRQRDVCVPRRRRAGAIAIAIGEAYADACADGAYHQQGGRECRNPEAMGTCAARPKLGSGRTSRWCASANSASRSCSVSMGPVPPLRKPHSSVRDE